MTLAAFSAKELNLARIGLLAICLVTFLAYRSILFNFFSGDDFVHLEWLYRAFLQPDMLWRNFVTNWPNVETCKFYRPLIPLSLAFDYAIWRNNGLGFHLTNVFIHLINALILYLVLLESGLQAIKSSTLIKGKTRDSRTISNADESSRGRSIQLWALSSAALFSIYPLHPEPVSWISGRVDTIVAMFLLSGLWFYLIARRLKNTVFYATSMLSFACALGSKEMAVAFPLVLVSFAILLPTLKSEPVKERVFKTLPFWICLMLYFVLRRFALGTFVGGYDDSLVVDPVFLITSWAHALKMMWLPFNAELFSPNDSTRIFWTITTIAAFFLCIGSMIRNRTARLLGIILLSWFFLTLLPVFKVLSISGDLQGSRLAYLATAPLCAILSLGCWSFKNDGDQAREIRNSFRKGVLLSMLVLSYLVLRTNNDPWRDSGRQSSAVLHELNKLYSSIKTDPPTYLVGLSDTIKGAYFMRNAIDGMTHYPQISRTVANCFAIDNFDPIFPFGFAKKSILTNSEARIFMWNSSDRQFAPFIVRCKSNSFKQVWRGSELRNLLEASSDYGAVSGCESSSLPSRQISKARKNHAVIFHCKDLPCWPSDILVFRIADLNDGENLGQFSLHYTNDLCPAPDLRHRVSGYFYKEDGHDEIAFPLHAESDWAFGGKCRTLTLMIPVNLHFTIDELRTEGPEKLIPKLTMDSTANQNSNGYIQLNSSAQACSLQFDIRDIKGANGALLEIGKPNQCFAVRNAAEPSRFVSAHKSYSQVTGTITLSKSDFGQDGIYQVRIRAVDIAGKCLGFASDHVNVAVEN